VQKKYGVGVKKGTVDWLDNVRKIPAPTAVIQTPEGKVIKKLERVGREESPSKNNEHNKGTDI